MAGLCFCASLVVYAGWPAYKSARARYVVRHLQHSRWEDFLLRDAEELEGLGEAGVEALVEGLLSDSGTIRDWTSILISVAHPKRAEVRKRLAEALATRLDDPETCEWAAHTLCDLREDNGVAVPALVARLKELRAALDRYGVGPQVVSVIRALRSIGEPARPAVPLLLSMLAERSYAAAPAAEALGVLGRAEEVVDPLSEAVLSSDRYLAACAARGLASIGPLARGAIPALTQALQHEHRDARREAAKAIRSMGPWAEEVIPALLEALHAEKDELAKGAIWGALRFIRPRTVEFEQFLVQTIRAEPEREIEIADMLGRMRPQLPETAGTLYDIYQRRSRSRDTALWALSQCGEHGRIVMPDLLRALRLPLSSGQVRIVWAVRDLGPPEESVPLLAALVEAKPFRGTGTQTEAAKCLGTMGGKAKPAVPALIRVLDTSLLGIEAAFALGGIGPSAGEAVPTLRELCAGKDESLAAAAHFALARIEGNEVEHVRALIGLLEHGRYWAPTHVTRALGELRPQSAEALSALTRVAQSHQSDSLRASALEALGKLKPAPQPVLLRIMEHALQDVETRHSAFKALAQLPWPRSVKEKLLRPILEMRTGRFGLYDNYGWTQRIEAVRILGMRE